MQGYFNETLFENTLAGRERELLDLSKKYLTHSNQTKIVLFLNTFTLSDKKIDKKNQLNHSTTAQVLEKLKRITDCIHHNKPMIKPF